MNNLNDREYWLEIMTKIAEPVLINGANRTLKKNFPRVESITLHGGAPRCTCGPIEAVARTLSGIAPWLELGEDDTTEGKMRSKYINLAIKTIDSITDPNSVDFWDFSGKGAVFAQEVIEAAYLSLSIVRAPKVLWEKLDEKTKKNLIVAIKSTRKIRPARSNWLIFSAMNEAALYVMEKECDTMRIDYVLSQFQQWYLGDGIYGDGPDYASDYYNSYVIHPMLVEIIEIISPLFQENSFLKAHRFAVDKDKAYGTQMLEFVYENATEYSYMLENLIAPDGTFPALGRSITYRFGAFQALSQIALKNRLDKRLSPAQVRCALTAVIKQCLDVEDTFDEEGWLTIGLCGKQPELSEAYISRGSGYLCSNGFLALGLDEKTEFWSGEPEKWSSQKIWRK